MGRDYLRLIREYQQDVPVFNEIWNLIVEQPQRLDPAFNGIEAFWDTVTPKEYIISRITPEIQSKLDFLLMNVSKPLDKPFVSRFRKQYCSGDSENSVSDIIRYVVSIIHPSNLVLASPIIQRWEFIFQLLTSTKVIIIFLSF